MHRYLTGSGKEIPPLISQLRHVCPSAFHPFFLPTWACFAPETTASDQAVPLAEPTKPRVPPLPPRLCLAPSSWEMGFAPWGKMRSSR